MARQSEAARKQVVYRTFHMRIIGPPQSLYIARLYALKNVNSDIAWYFIAKIFKITTSLIIEVERFFSFILQAHKPVSFYQLKGLVEHSLFLNESSVDSPYKRLYYSPHFTTTYCMVTKWTTHIKQSIIWLSYWKLIFFLFVPLRCTVSSIYFQNSHTGWDKSGNVAK